MKVISKASKYVISFSFILILLVMGAKLFQDKAWFLAIFFFLSAGLIFYTYSISKSTPAKYLLPGVLLLTLFHIYPAFYSGAVAFTNDSNGHQLSKEQAISAIVQDSKVPIDSLEPIRYQTLLEEGSNKVSILFKYQSDKYFLANGETVQTLAIDPANILADGSVSSLGGFRVLNPSEVQKHITELQTLVVILDSGITVQPQDLETLEASQPAFVYDKVSDKLRNTLSGEIYTPNDNGQMESASAKFCIQAGKLMWVGGISLQSSPTKRSVGRY